jgi:hypothetical protein
MRAFSIYYPDRTTKPILLMGQRSYLLGTASSWEGS